MSIDERVHAVIRALYDAAMDESLWPTALKQLTDFTGSQGASFWVLDGSDQPRLPTFTTINFDPKFIEEYLDDMVPMDPTVQYLVRHPNQRIVHDGLVITEREKDRHPYYDWQARYSDIRFRMVGQVRPALAVQAGVALHRTRTVGRYESDDLERFSVLYGHLEKALAIGFRLGALGALQQCTTELLDRNPAAVLLLDEHKRVVYANGSAEALRSSGDGLKLSADGIVALRKQDHDRLQCLIAQVLSAVTLPGACPGGVMRALRPSGKRPYTILVAPVSQRYPVLSVLRPAVCIMITDPDEQRPLPSHRVQAAFGLTESEARLAVLLAGGAELRSAAAEVTGQGDRGGIGDGGGGKVNGVAAGVGEEKRCSQRARSTVGRTRHGEYCRRSGDSAENRQHDQPCPLDLDRLRVLHGGFLSVGLFSDYTLACGSCNIISAKLSRRRR